jgi:glycosyltransferase involved in cell wall biosynthesis
LKFPENRFRQAIVRGVLERATLCMATHIITVCEYAANREFLYPYRNKFVGVVPNGVDFPVMALENRMRSRRDLNVLNNEVVAVCVSRLTREKGYFLLADTLRVLPPINSKLILLIVGNGPDRILIENAMRGVERAEVRYLGHRNDVGNILSAADFFISPSLHENLSNALLEAMSYGLPVVATDVGGNTEVLIRGGGTLVSIDDLDSLGQAIANYVNDENLRYEDGARAREVIEENYTTQHMAERLGAVYRDILSSGKL